MFSRRAVLHGGHEWSADDVQDPASGMRPYRALPDAHWILARDGRPDHRVPVHLV